MKPLLTLIVALTLSGCTHAFACKGFPQFSACKSATQAYRATNKGAPSDAIQESPPEDLGERPRPPSRTGTLSGEPGLERSPAQTLKIWQPPYEDDNGDLIGSSSILTEIEPRRWRMGQSQTPVPRRLIPLQVAIAQNPPPQPASEDRGGFPLFPTSQGPRRLHVEEADYREP